MRKRTITYRNPTEKLETTEEWDCYKLHFLFPGAFTPNEDLAKEIFAAAESSGEKIWRLPLEESYWESMKSGVADMINTGPGQGGAITAALFLKQVDIIFFVHLLEKEKFMFG